MWQGGDIKLGSKVKRNEKLKGGRCMERWGGGTNWVRNCGIKRLAVWLGTTSCTASSSPLPAIVYLMLWKGIKCVYFTYIGVVVFLLIMVIYL